MVEYATYIGRDNTQFLVTHQPVFKKVIVRTPKQEFYLFQDEWHNEENIEMMIYFIENGYINDLPSLFRRLKGRFSLVPCSSKVEA
jgi:hypothetical protein